MKYDEGCEVDFKNLVDKTYKKYKEKLKNKLNIMIVGKTGVGKSSLINAIFGKKVTQIGSGKPITKEIEKLSLNDNFNIYDTVGLELGTNGDTIIKNLKDFLEKNAKQPAKDQIHIIWFCISESGRRIEDTEKELHKLFENKNYKSILVVTKTEKDADINGVKFSDLVKKEFNKTDDEFVATRSIEYEDDDGYIKKKKGIDELVEKSYKLLNEAQKHALVREQKNNMKLKKLEAQKIVKKYTIAASAIPATPIPFSDMALILPTQITMILHISNIYNLEVDYESIKKIIVSSMAATGIGFVAKTIAGNMLKFIPIVGSIAGAGLNSVIAGSATNLIGNAYIAYLEDNWEGILDGSFDIFLNSGILSEYINREKQNI